MTTLLTTISLLVSFPFGPLAQHDKPPGGMSVQEGLLSQYAESPTIDTLYYRQYVTGQIPQDLPDNTIFIAVADCDWIGRQGFISVNGGEWEPAWVFDCAGSAKAYNWLIDNGFIGEVDYYTAERHGVVCRCAVDGRVVWIED